jgi:hypothetical protein
MNNKPKQTFLKRRHKGLGMRYSFIVEHLPSMCKSLRLLPRMTKKGRYTNDKEGYEKNSESHYALGKCK